MGQVRDRIKISLWKKFKFSFIWCVLFTIYIPLFTSVFFGTIYALFSSKEKITNYTTLISDVGLWNKNWELNKQQFILVGVLAVSLFFLFSYLYEFFARKLMIRAASYLKNQALKKFQKLPLPEQTKRKGEIISLVEKDNEIVAYYWVNFWRKMVEGLLAIGLCFYTFFYQRWNQSQDPMGIISNKVLFFTFFWLILIVGIIYLLYKINHRWGKLSKETTAQEHVFINQEINNQVLINSMGLTSKHEEKQRKLTQKSNQSKTVLRRRFGLETTVPWKLLTNLFPFGLLIIEPNFIGASFSIIWTTLNNCTWAFGYLVHWSDYASSRTRVDNFLRLPERNDNLKGIKIENNWKIEKIKFQQVFFRYPGQPKPLIFNSVFLKNKINYLSTSNGSGKTTQSYLLLGLLEPKKGKIIIESSKEFINLKKVNLFHWRSKVVAYCSYKTLIENGSAGQKQLINIKQVLEQRKESQIFIFDEADNALDAEGETWFQEQLKSLVREGKLVICIRLKKS